MSAVKVAMAARLETFDSVGFKLPSLVFTKPDPMGLEYGVFEAKVRDNGTIEVWHTGGQYRMVFEDELYFRRWAQATT